MLKFKSANSDPRITSLFPQVASSYPRVRSSTKFNSFFFHIFHRNYFCWVLLVSPHCINAGLLGKSCYSVSPLSASTSYLFYDGRCWYRWRKWSFLTKKSIFAFTWDVTSPPPVRSCTYFRWLPHHFQPFLYVCNSWPLCEPKNI